MVVSVIYDGDIKSRVFQVRDSERYTNSTQTTLEVEYVANYRSHMSVTLTATVNRKIGESSVAFYDGEELLGVVNCGESDSSVELIVNSGYGYHKFYAKYLGNSNCLSSKSGITELTVTEPDLPTPTVTFTPTDGSQWLPRSNGFGGTVAFAGSNGISNKSIKIYDNDELATTITTNSNGQATLSLTDLDIGVHNIKILFEGDDAYLADDVEYSFATGFIITATPTSTSIASGTSANFVVNVAVPDFNYTDDSDDVEATVLLKVGNTLHDSDTFIGEKTLTSNALSSNSQFRIIDNGDDENIITESINVIPIGSVSLTSDATIISNEISTLLTATVKNNNNVVVPNVPVVIHTDDNATSYSGVTDSSGQVVMEYTGTALGETLFYAECGTTISDALVIYDMIQYYSASNNINYNFSFFMKNSLKSEYWYDGIKFIASSNIDGHVEFAFLDVFTSDWVFEADVVYVDKNSEGMQLSGATIWYNQLKSKPHLTIRKTGEQRKCYVDDTLVSTSSNPIVCIPYFVILYGSTVKFDNIKLYKV